jgi:hypothetical protein
LTSLGYLVWYDLVNMGLDIQQSMVDGIARSQFFIGCVESGYQGRPNCQIEYQEAAKTSKPMIAVVLEDIGDVFGQPNKKWKVSPDLNAVFSFKQRMFQDMSRLASNPIWQECHLKNEDPPDDLMEQLNACVMELVSKLAKGGCHPSLPPKS